MGDGSGHLLAAGQHLGPYEITRPLGEGGMGQVWQARDTLIGRDVAIKIIAARFAGDADRVLRFEQEARTVGQLNHPNILTLYAVGREAGAPYLVTELLAGQTLRDRIRQGALPPDKALDYAIQIACGLAAAHAKGVVHRDLKPENLFLTSEGRVKILDFGIAKLTSPDTVAGATLAETATGVIMGTLGYMSPEQARGQPVDARSDIFAFGAVLYEMLSGRAAFPGQSGIDVLNAVLSSEPAPLTGVPPVYERLIRHAIEKEPNARFQSAQDLAFHLETIRDPTVAVTADLTGAGRSCGRAARWRAVPLAWAAAAAALGAVAGVLAGISWSSAPEQRVALPLSRLSLTLPSGTQLAPTNWPAAGASVAISADGRSVAFVAVRNGARTLGIRSLESGSLKMMAGSEGAMSPFFSPDGRWVGFFTDTELKKVSVDDGTLVSVCRTPPVTRGGVWGRDDTIYFAPSYSAGLQRVHAAGGVPEDVTEVRFDAGESNHLFPELLPGEETLLFTVWNGGSFKDASVWSHSLRTGARQPLLDSATAPRYVSAGFLVFAREGVLFAVRFDAVRAIPVGDPFPVVDGVWTDPATGSAHFAVGRDGTLVFAAGLATTEQRRFMWVNRQDGRAVPTNVEPNAYDSFQLSPDGRRVAVGLMNDIWVYDLQADVWNRATYHGVNQFPVWTKDGHRIAISSSQGVDRPTLFWIAPEGGQPAVRISDEGTVQFPGSWAPDGRRLAYAARPLGQSESGWDIRMLDLDGQPAPSSLVATTFTDEMPEISPDGRALAYVSDETGRQEVYLRPFPGQGARIKVSANGGTEPVWSRQSGELFFRDGRKMYAVRVDTQGQLAAGPPVVLFEGDYLFISSVPGAPTYDVAPDGRFLMLSRADEQPTPGQIEVVLNWAGELDRRAPVRR